MLNAKRDYVYLFGILLLALFLRTYDLSNNPPELFLDELINYVSARDIIEKGGDLYGQVGIYFTDRVIEHRPPVYGYTSYLASLIVGENAWAIRGPAVFYGLISIIAVFLLALELFRDRRAALMAAFFMAIIPWHIHFSRVGWEPASFLPFLLFSTYFFLYGVNNNKKSLVVLSFALFSLTNYTYHTAPLFAFLFLLTLFLTNIKYFLKDKKLLSICILVAGVLVIPYLWEASTEYHMLKRARGIYIFSEGFGAGTLITFAKTYLSHISPNFLFIYGDPFPRYGAWTGGLLHLIMFPFIVFGIVGLIFSDLERRYRIFLLVWLLIFPLAVALTNDWGMPHSARVLPGAPILCLLSGFGFVLAYQHIKSEKPNSIYPKALVLGVILLSLVSLGYFSRDYYGDYPKRSYQFWEYGNKEIFSIIKPVQHKYKRACLLNLNLASQKPILAYYMPESNLEIIRGIDDPRCLERGSIIVQSARKKEIHTELSILGEVKDPDGYTLYLVQAVE
ncbi:MAG: glycosyltransferase family 39 protein [Thermodesulfobacteriota bacterium]